MSARKDAGHCEPAGRGNLLENPVTNEGVNEGRSPS